MYVGGQDDRDIDNFLENNLADYDEFQLWATSYCTTPVNDQSCVERMVSVKCNNCIRRMSEIARLGE